jgi:hypothetical protein
MNVVLCGLALTVLTWPGPTTTNVAAQKAAASTTRVPDWSEQLTIRERLLIDRHKLILPMMRRHGIAMWIVVNEEFPRRSGHPDDRAAAALCRQP